MTKLQKFLWATFAEQGNAPFLISTTMHSIRTGAECQAVTPVRPHATDSIITLVHCLLQCRTSSEFFHRLHIETNRLSLAKHCIRSKFQQSRRHTNS